MNVIFLAAALAWIVGFVGWIMNLVKLVPLFMVDGPLVVTGMLVGRTVGVFFAPLGAVLGFF